MISISSKIRGQASLIGVIGRFLEGFPEGGGLKAPQLNTPEGTPVQRGREGGVQKTEGGVCWAGFEWVDVEEDGGG